MCILSQKSHEKSIGYNSTAHNLVDLVKKINLLSMVDFVKASWNSVSEITIKKCFKNYRFQKSKNINVDAMR